MRLPTKLEQLLAADQGLYGCVLLSIASFEPILRHNRLPFFPEYTDHGIEHVESVLVAAASVIADESWEVLTPADAAALTLAILLHDIAMHLSDDGFVSLVGGEGSEAIPLWSEDQPWPHLWQDFLGEASRFDGRTLTDMFGAPDPIVRPLLDTAKWTRRDRLLIGEFLRRHHARLAHEIAICALPGSAPKVGLVNVPDYLGQLAGIIARSHGMPIRSCASHLEQDFGRREFKGVRAAFLMTIVRVADYIQVQAERAPASVLSIQALTSPISRREWDAHHAISDIRNTEDDPEAIFIQASPSDVSTYLRIRSWLSGIQHELDSSWAVLGELYGRVSGLDQLGLVIRRVTSNLDDCEAFAASVDYVPDQVSFEAANSDVLKLLIGPLYGDDPAIGVRELVQNAVDAVRELREYAKKRPELQGFDQYGIPNNEDVLLYYEEIISGKGSLTVTDRGIGMTAEIVKDYFLKAGASSRTSDAWRSSYEDSEGRPTVLRSGRFGVGVLAAFLIGDEITVTTRHAGAASNDGISFRASIEDEHIQLNRVSCPVGTQVTVRVRPQLVEDVRNCLMSSEAHGGVHPDMYCLCDPAVGRIVKTDAQFALDQLVSLPGPEASPPPEWGLVDWAEEGIKVFWTYRESVPQIACNGIVIAAYDRLHSRGHVIVRDSPEWSKHWGAQPVHPPRISVFDPQGRFPVNLQRTGVAPCRRPCISALQEDIFRDLLAFLLVWGPQDPSDYIAAPRSRRFSHPALVKDVTSPLLLTETGYVLISPALISHLALENIVLVVRPDEEMHLEPVPRCTLFSVPRSGLASVYIEYGEDDGVEYAHHAPVSFCANSICSTDPWHDNGYSTQRMCELAVTGRRFAVTEELDRRAADYRALPPDDCEKEGTSKYCDMWRAGALGSALSSLTAFADALIEAESSFFGGAIALWELANARHEGPIHDLDRIWLEIVGERTIPYEPEKRRGELARAYETLAPYIRRHEARC